MNNAFKFWKKHQFKIIVAGSCATIFLLYWFNTPGNGTWTLEYSYNPDTKQMKIVKQSKGELECRRVMEKLFMCAFPSRRPDFLTNDITGKPLEIDCCNLDLKLGVEYNGIQHYQYTKTMQKNYQDFQLQQYRDQMKLKKCQDNDFHLIIVPYTIPVESIENFLIDRLRQLGFL